MAFFNYKNYVTVEDFFKWKSTQIGSFDQKDKTTWKRSSD